MKLHRILAAPCILALSAAALTTGCADELDVPIDGPAPQASAEVEVVSKAGLQIEQAERILDRGGNATEALALLKQALAEPDVTDAEVAAATLALSHAHEALGQHEQAVAVLEAEMGQHADDPSWSSKGFKERLRELLTGSPERTGIQPRFKAEAPPFARMLSGYFPSDDDGKFEVSIYMIGRHHAADDLETFEVGSGLRAEREETCPLCDTNLSVHTHRSQSDWLMIPVAESKFDQALVVFYFDLGINRIPARYERLLPMKVAEIENELNDGKSFALAVDRPGAPPVVLIAAPRTAMLKDVEAHLSKLSELPIEKLYVENDANLRPEEIQGIVRADYFPEARSCYESLLKRDPQATGKVHVRFKVSDEGVVSKSTAENAEGTLDEEAFLSCMSTAVTALKFPATGHGVTVSYPILFTPN